VCSIFLLDEDGQHLRYAAAPNLSDEYRIATDGVCIGTRRVHAAQRLPTAAVFVSDVRSHPHFANFKDLIVLTGLRASWSSPIMSHDGRVLGTFGMFYREVREPGPAEIQMITTQPHRRNCPSSESARARNSGRTSAELRNSLISFLNMSWSWTRRGLYFRRTSAARL